MTNACDDGRALKGLDAREAQAVLRDEFAPAEDMMGTNEMPEGETEETSAGAPRQWSDEERALHLRMTEALLFAAMEPLDEATIAGRLPQGADVGGAIAALEETYRGGGVQLVRVSGKWRFVTANDLAHILETEQVQPRKLSRAALETLAIIAYHQPCTRADIEDVRGVAVSRGSLDMLLDIGWVALKGRRKDSPGRPVLYATTETFLEHFGLESVADLPGMSDLKAAGLLDARLPPGFAVPSPSDVGDVEDDVDDEMDGAEFAQDFLEDSDDKAAGA
ncbi:MAG: SMC-Scp complex subunit ScpB [Parvularculaceae bacterium]